MIIEIDDNMILNLVIKMGYSGDLELLKQEIKWDILLHVERIINDRKEREKHLKKILEA